MKKNFTSLSLLILLCINFYASTILIAANKNNSQSSYQEGSYQPGILVMKIKPEFRSLCSKDAVSQKQLNDGLTLIAASGITKKFPHATAPVEKMDRSGNAFVDLSLIYQCEFSPVIKIEEAIKIIKSTGIVEYVEPLFIRYLNFTPNDPSLGQQYALGKINAYAAWDVWTGDTNVVIGIVDTGTDPDHPDLAANIKHNYADPVDGLDNDSDGFVDNFGGWDVSDNDNDPTVGVESHGSHVSGCADAVTNNGVGVAAPGYNCKFLPVKSTHDVSTLVDNPTDGIVYAADHGVNVINCSFGGGNYSQMEQDVMNYATINKGALICASAGNGGIEENQFPASYENVLSVASTGTSDGKSGFSSYGSSVDVCAPGSNIFSTIYNNSYAPLSGTSMSSPIAAGCAAMIKSRFPAMTALQVGEQLRTTCDNIYISGGNSAYIGKLGKGRVNLYKALTDSLSPGVILKDNHIVDGNDNVFIVGDTLSVFGLLENLLRPTTNLTCTLSTTNSFVQVLQSGFTAGVMNTFDTLSNFTTPFRVYIKPTAPVNTVVQLRLTLNDGAWNDIYIIEVTVNVDYINIAINNVATSITSKSLVGYNQTGQLEGLGFTYKNSATLLYDMGLMVGVQNIQVSDNVRSVTNNDEDFIPYFNVSSIEPGVISDFDINGSFQDAGLTSTTPLNIMVSHHAYAWVAAPNNNYVMVQYSIKNIGSSSLTNLYAGLFADWDIPLYSNNKCSTDLARRMGYIWSTDSLGLWAGIKLLSHTGGFNHQAIDNISTTTGILMNDGFDDAEKFTSLSAFNADAGTGSATGNDVISVVSSGGVTLAPGDSVEVSFALIAGEDLASLQTSADAAQWKYDSTFVGILPIGKSLGNELMQGYPNPADKDLKIDFSLKENNYSELSIYNLVGEKVKSIVHENLSAGKYSLHVDISELPAGHYFYRLVSGNYMKTLPLSVAH